MRIVLYKLRYHVLKSAMTSQTLSFGSVTVLLCSQVF